MSDTKPTFLRIRAAPYSGTGAMPTRGTIVETLDGQRVTGVTGITLRAGLSDVWRATIECHVQVQGDLDVEVTDLADTESRQFAAAAVVMERVPARLLVRELLRRCFRRR